MMDTAQNTKQAGGSDRWVEMESKLGTKTVKYLAVVCFQ